MTYDVLNLAGEYNSVKLPPYARIDVGLARILGGGVVRRRSSFAVCFGCQPVQPAQRGGRGSGAWAYLPGTGQRRQRIGVRAPGFPCCRSWGSSFGSDRQGEKRVSNRNAARARTLVLMSIGAAASSAGCDYVRPSEVFVPDGDVIAIGVVLSVGWRTAYMIASHPHKPGTADAPVVEAVVTGPSGPCGVRSGGGARTLQCPHHGLLAWATRLPGGHVARTSPERRALHTGRNNPPGPV